MHMLHANNSQRIIYYTEWTKIIDQNKSNHRNITFNKSNARKLSDENLENFKSAIENTDWSELDLIEMLPKSIRNFKVFTRKFITIALRSIKRTQIKNCSGTRPNHGSSLGYKAHVIGKTNFITTT